MNEAYRKYLIAFPQYWDPNRHTPKTEEEFESFYKLALNLQDRYDREMKRGILNPVTRYAKLNFDQFLGITHDKENMSGAFRLAFKG